MRSKRGTIIVGASVALFLAWPVTADAQRGGGPSASNARPLFEIQAATPGQLLMRETGSSLAGSTAVGGRVGLQRRDIGAILVGMEASQLNREDGSGWVYSPEIGGRLHVGRGGSVSPHLSLGLFRSFATSRGEAEGEALRSEGARAGIGATAFAARDLSLHAEIGARHSRFGAGQDGFASATEPYLSAGVGFLFGRADRGRGPRARRHAEPVPARERGTRSARSHAEGPRFCRSGEGHPRHGWRWCAERGYEMDDAYADERIERERGPRRGKRGRGSRGRP